MKKWFTWGFIVCLALGALSLPFAAIMYWYNQPRYTGTMQLQGLHGPVTVTRDQWGVPHIVAQTSDLDAFFALGYVHAQDRFWQMELQRHIIQGTLSELFGKTTVEKDKYLRTWGFYRAALTAWPAFSPHAKAIVQSYTDGVNAYIQQQRFPFPIQLLQDKPKPWTVIDSIAWQKMLAWDLQTHWLQQLHHYQVAQQLGVDQIPVLYPPYPSQAPTILSDADLAQSHLLSTAATLSNNHAAKINPQSLSALQTADQQLRQFLHMQHSASKGSNNWVVSGRWTTTGKPMLANDPHLELQAPPIWYLVELKGPTLHVIGATIPGMPGIVIGHNDHIAWGVTNVNPDSQDLYVVPRMEKVAILQETIHVHDAPSIQFPVVISAVGPVISQINDGKNNYPLALQWTALQPNDTTVQSMLEIDYAQNWPAFVNALKDFIVPSQNFVYADTQGNIGYYLAGKIPVRTWSSLLPVPDDARHQWQGFIPFDQLPHVFNPPEGLIVTANNKAVSDNYPYTIATRWPDPPYRAQRILQLIHQLQPLSIQKNAQIQLDTVSLFWQALAPTLLQTKPLDNLSQQALDQLKTWNGDADLSSVPATIFAYWYRQLAHLTPAPIAAKQHWPNPLFLVQQLQQNSHYCVLAGSKNCQDFLSTTLKTATQQLRITLGRSVHRWQWQRIHYAYFQEIGLGNAPGIGALWNREIPTPGSMYTINVAPFDLENFKQTEGASYRQIVDLSDFNHSLYIQTLGQSNDPLNAHYTDQMPLWRNGQYLPMSSEAKAWGKTQVLKLEPIA